MNWYKISKHVSNTSHTCLYCHNLLIPTGFAKNNRHHFPWGITYQCNCKKSGIWTNSIRGEKEFMDVVFKNVPPQNNSSWHGFCNDKFCLFCYKYITVLINGVYMTNDNQPATTIKEKEKEKWNIYSITNLDEYLISYNKNLESSQTYNPNFMGKKIDPNLITKSIDIHGCSSLEHNLQLFPNDKEEYREGEYKPIYEWIINNKNKIPKNMIAEFKKEISQ